MLYNFDSFVGLAGLGVNYREHAGDPGPFVRIVVLRLQLHRAQAFTKRVIFPPEEGIESAELGMTSCDLGMRPHVLFKKFTRCFEAWGGASPAVADQLDAAAQIDLGQGVIIGRQRVRPPCLQRLFCFAKVVLEQVDVPTHPREQVIEVALVGPWHTRKQCICPSHISLPPDVEVSTTNLVEVPLRSDRNTVVARSCGSRPIAELCVGVSESYRRIEITGVDTMGLLILV